MSNVDISPVITTCKNILMDVLVQTYNPNTTAKAVGAQGQPQLQSDTLV